MPAAIPLIGLAISAGTSVAGMVSANKKAKEAKKAIDNYSRQDLTNSYAGIQTSTLGADRQREDMARTLTTMANNAAMGGSRSIFGIAPQLINYQNQNNAQIAANLDQQEAQRQQLIAGGDMQVQQQQTQIENNDLLGLGNMYQTARAERANAINNLAQNASSLASLASYNQSNGNNIWGNPMGTGITGNSTSNGWVTPSIFGRNFTGGFFGRQTPASIGSGKTMNVILPK